MILEFYRCFSCKRLDEKRRMLARHGCVCGVRKFNPSRATAMELAIFLVKHPGYLINALRGKE